MPPQRRGRHHSRTHGNLHGTRLNLERPLRVGDELGGHMWAAIVFFDGIAELAPAHDLDHMARLAFRARRSSPASSPPKGSVALEGVSLRQRGRGRDASRAVTPPTLEVTTSGRYVRRTPSISKST